MTLILIVVMFGILISVLFVFLFVAGVRNRTRDLNEISARIREVDVDSFRRLMNPADREFLRTHLSPLAFRRIHWERTLAAAEYVWAAAVNARIIMQLAEAAEHDANAAVVNTAERLKQNASVTWLHAFKTMPRLLASAVVPSLNLEYQFLARSYANIFREVLMLHVVWCSDQPIP